MPTQCAELVVRNDNILEDDETFLVQLTSRSDQVVITSGGEQAEVVIREDNTDCKCVPQIRIDLSSHERLYFSKSQNDDCYILYTPLAWFSKLGTLIGGLAFSNFYRLEEPK